MSRGENDEMSGREFCNASILNHAGFYLPVSGEKTYPDLDMFKNMVRVYDYVPLFAQIRLDHFNAVNFFRTLNPSRPSCLLESLSGYENGRYSVIGSNSLFEIVSYRDDPEGENKLHNFLERVRVPNLDFPFFSGGLLGYWTYEAGLGYQGISSCKNGFVEQYFFSPGEVLVYDRHSCILTVVVWVKTCEEAEKAYRKACERLNSLLLTALNCQGKEEQHSFKRDSRQLDEEFKVNISKEEFSALVNRAREHIRQGDIFQVVLSRRWQKRSKADPWQVYLNLRGLNPSPYMFYFLLPDCVLMGASPEMQVKVEKGRVKTRPIAGTCRITGDKDVDDMLCKKLLTDEKEKAEHLMLVDLARNDVGRVSRAGTVKIGEFMTLERYSHVVHIVSSVEGEIKPGVDALEVFKACFPAGTLSGAPKRKAMEIIDELEVDPRGPYGGAVGFVTFEGFLDSCITIRSILYKKGTYYLQSGAGIVADSVPESEHEETLNKARALMLAVKEAEERK